MAYIVRKVVNGKGYYYLVSTVKYGKKTKKYQLYLGKKLPGKAELARYSKLIKVRVENAKRIEDPLLSIIQKNTLSKLEGVRKWYEKLQNQSPAVRKNYYEWFVTTYTYDSNAIEGSTLTLRETGMLLFEGTTPPGRPVKDMVAAQNHKKAFDWLLKYRGDISLQFILRLHRILTENILLPEESGKLRTVQVYVRGAEQIPPRPANVLPDLKNLIKWYNSNKRRYHPVVLAAYFHIAFEYIHPFVDFNGRSGRLLLNFILLKNDYPPVDIRNRERLLYYRAIRAGIGANINPLAKLIVKYLKELVKVREAVHTD